MGAARQRRSGRGSGTAGGSIALAATRSNALNGMQELRRQLSL